MSLGTAATIPGAITMTTTDAKYIGFDLTGALNGATISGTPTVTLTDMTEGTTVALTGSASVAGNVVTTPQISGLVVDHVYQARMVFVTSAGNTDTRILTIVVTA